MKKVSNYYCFGCGNTFEYYGRFARYCVYCNSNRIQFFIPLKEGKKE